MTLYTLEGVTKEYGQGNSHVVALDGVTVDIPEEKIVVVLGASGSGKSTLLNMLGCMDRPTRGRIEFLGEDITAFSVKQMTNFRGRAIGFVFQSYNLLSDLTALENVEFSTELAGLPRSQAGHALVQVGLSERMNHYPAELSGGEQQRVSIARAIAKKPKVLLCDEPTGALDFRTGVLVLDAITSVSRESGTTVILITHNQEIAKVADVVITLRSGEIAGVEENASPLSASQLEW